MDFFTSDITLEKLTVKLRALGFIDRTYYSDLDGELPSLYKDEVHVVLGDAKGHMRVPSDSPHNPDNNGFRVILNRNLQDYEPNHPLRIFFRDLKNPQCHGVGDFLPRFGLEKYL